MGRHGVSATVRPRTVVIAMLVLVLIAAALIAVWVLPGLRDTDGVRLAELPAGKSVGLAGVFPSGDDTRLAGPRGIVIDDLRVYVAEADAGRVSVFSLTGARLGEITIDPSEGQARSVPTNLALDAAGRLAVVEAAGSRVLLFSVDDLDAVELVTEIDLESATAMEVQPGAIAFRNGVLHVTDSLSRSVLMYNEDGVFAGSLGQGVEPALFYPGGIAFLGRGVALTSTNDARVLVLGDAGDEVVRDLAGEYVFPGGLVALDDASLAVADALKPAVYVLDASGRVSHLIDAGTISGEAPIRPEALAWHARDERLYVTDSRRGAVLIFNIKR